MWSDRQALIGGVRFAAIDFESAGVSPGKTDVPIQVGWGILENNQIDPALFFRRYIYTDQPITWSAARVHGISRQHLEKAESFESFWPEVKRSLEPCVMVAHGHATEKRFLRQFPTHRLGPWVDTLQLARRYADGLTDYSLESVITGFELEGELRALCPDHSWHDALFDAVGCLVILRYFIGESALGKRPLDILL